MLNTVLICGSGGFIGGHLTKRLREIPGHHVRAVDKKPLSQWHQVIPDVENLCLDLSRYEDCRRACEGATDVYQLAADMGGIGFIETEHVACMRNVLINAHMLEAAYRAGVERFLFSSSACVYAAGKQNTVDLPALKEEDAYPAQPEPAYGEEKLYTERLAQEYYQERGMATFIPRFHNIMGTHTDWCGGREKAPAAICRKVAECAAVNSNIIEIWGDGTATRSFCWIDDCIEGILKIIECDSLIATPINLGSSELVSINQLVDYVEEIAGIKLTRYYNLTAPQGVRGRNSDNTFIKSVLAWEPETPLREGLEKLYPWVAKQYRRRKAGEKVPL